MVKNRPFGRCVLSLSNKFFSLVLFHLMTDPSLLFVLQKRTWTNWLKFFFSNFTIILIHVSIITSTFSFACAWWKTEIWGSAVDLFTRMKFLEHLERCPSLYHLTILKSLFPCTRYRYCSWLKFVFSRSLY